jgi:hypothetical protein
MQYHVEESPEKPDLYEKARTDAAQPQDEPCCCLARTSSYTLAADSRAVYK